MLILKFTLTYSKYGQLNLDLCRHGRIGAVPWSKNTKDLQKVIILIKGLMTITHFKIKDHDEVTDSLGRYIYFCRLIDLFKR